jgi:hypothetical protein
MISISLSELCIRSPTSADMHRLFCTLLLLLLSSLPVVARAQVTGSVTDAQGRPIESAAVELWAGERQIAVQTTASDGRFAFPTEAARGATGLLARHPGYQPSRLQVVPSASDVVVRLATKPVALEGVTATVTQGRLCPNREAPEARALWAASAARYSQALDSSAVGSRFAWNERTVPFARDVGAVAPEALQRNAGVGNPAIRRSWFAQVERSGYAYRITGESVSPEFGPWYYPLAFMGPHFVSEVFGRLHTLSIVERDGSQVVIAFCPRSGVLSGKPRVQGTLRISVRDTLLTEAYYAFRALVYAPASAPDGRPLPVPSTDLFWRRPLGSHTFYQRYREYVRWELGGNSGLPATWTNPLPAERP